MSHQAERLKFLSPTGDKEKSIPNAVSVISGKGGTGKTFFAVNFALQLSEYVKKVLLVDFDLNFANVHILLNAEPRFTLSDFFAGRVLFEDIISKYNEKLDLISGDNGNFDVLRDEADLARLFKKISEISPEYDAIIFDNSSGISSELFTSVKNSKYSLIVLNPELTSVLDSYVVLKAFGRKKIRVNPLVVVNKKTDDANALQTFENFSKATKKFLRIEPELLGFVPYDSTVTKSLTEMKTLEEVNPESPSLQGIKAIVEKFAKKNQLANIRQSASQVI